MASLDDRRPSHDIVQDDIVGTLTVDVCSLPYFTADRLLVTRVHRITAAHSHRSQIVSSAAGTSADDTLPRVFLNHDSRPTAQILADTSSTSLFCGNSAGAAPTLREIMDSSLCIVS